MKIDLRRKLTVAQPEIERVGRAAMEDPGDDLVATLCTRCWHAAPVAVNRLRKTCAKCGDRGKGVDTFVVVDPDGNAARAPEPVDPASLPDLQPAPAADVEKLIVTVQCGSDMTFLWHEQVIFTEPTHRVLARPIQRLSRDLQTRYGRGIVLRFARKETNFDQALRPVSDYWTTRAPNPWCALHWELGSGTFPAFLATIETPLTFEDLLVRLAREYSRQREQPDGAQTTTWSLLAASAAATYPEFDNPVDLAQVVAAETRALNAAWQFRDCDVAAPSSANTLSTAVELFRDQQGDVKHSVALGIFFLVTQLERYPVKTQPGQHWPTSHASSGPSSPISLE